MVFILILGSSSLYLFGNRHFIDPYTYGVLGTGIAFYGLLRARQSWWGGPLCACGLSLLWQTHGVFLPFVIGFTAFAVMVYGLKAFKSAGLWLGTAVLLAWNHAWIIAFFSHGLGQPQAGFSLMGWLGLAKELLFTQALGLLSGSRIALYAVGDQAWYIPPLAPLILMGCLLAWPWLKPPRAGKSVLRSLAIMAALILLITAWVITGQEIRYAYPLTLTLLIWLALFSALAANAGGRMGRVFRASAGVLALCGLYGYFAWLAPFANSGGACFNVPGAVFNSERMINKRELYYALAAQKRAVHFDHWDRFSMVFHELEDESGRRGVFFSGKTVPGGLTVFL